MNKKTIAVPSAPIEVNPMLPAVFFGYGGMKFTQKTKLHIVENSGNVLCGVKSNWMEATQCEINKDGFLENETHLFPITDERSKTCQKCLKRWLSLNGR